MREFKIIGGINLLILIIYTVFLKISDNPHDSLAIGIYSAMLIAIHVIVNIIASLVYFGNKNKALGKAYLLSAALILLVGFSTCLLNMQH